MSLGFDKVLVFISTPWEFETRELKFWQAILQMLILRVIRLVIWTLILL